MSRFTKGKGIRDVRWVLVAVAATAVLASASLAVAQEMGAGAKALAKLEAEWSAAAGKKDAALVASYYTEDAIVYPPGQPAVVGREAAQKVWAGLLSDPTFSLSWKTVHAGVSGDLGYTTGTYQSSFKGPDGKMVAEVGKYVTVWKKQKDGSWKAVHDIWNADSK